MGTLAHIYRHPIKAHGAERVETVTLTANATLPWDRVWALVHERSHVDGSKWERSGNFSRGATSPSLMAITCTFDEASEKLTLSPPRLPTLTVNPDRNGEEIIEWVRAIMPPEGRASARVIRAGSAAQGQGMTDNAEPYLSLLGLSSLRALSGKAGRDLSPLRFRGNLWVDGLGPWEEFEWVGKSIRIGAAEFSVEDRIDRCPATMVNPDTGRRDTDTLDLLREGWGHIDFGVFARVTKAGPIAIGDPVEVIG